MDLWILGVVILIVWIIGILFRKRINDVEFVEIQPGILTIHTQKGISFIDKIYEKGKRFWNSFWKIGGVVGIIAMFSIFILIIVNTVYIFTVGLPQGAEAGMMVLVPGVTVPFLLSLVGIVVAVLIHEPAHGLAFRANDLSIKSVGVGIMVAIPLAFVQEDREEMENLSPFKKIKVAGAGPFVNILFAFIILGLILGLTSPYSEAIVGKRDDPLNIGKGGRLVSIDNYKIDNLENYSNIVSSLDNEDNIRLNIADREDIVLNPKENNVKELLFNYDNSLFKVPGDWNFLDPLYVLTVGTLEVRGTSIINEYTYSSAISWRLLTIMKWIFSLNLLIGLFNLLPVKILDGGHVFSGLVEKVTSKEKSQKLVKAMSFTLLVMILLNFTPLLFNF